MNRKILMKGSVIALLICGAFIFSQMSKTQKKPKPLASIYPPYLPPKEKMMKNFDAIVRANPQKKEEMKQFINDFPYLDYQIYSLPRLGTFYIDKSENAVKAFLSRGNIWEKHNYNQIMKYTKKGSTVIDVGAYMGSFTMLLGKFVGPSGKVIAFEPQPKIFRELFMNTLLNNLHNTTLFWGGAGEKEAMSELSHLNLTNEVGTSLRCAGINEFVEVKTIDSLSLSNVSLIKIDVEGMENEVLDGAKKTILQNKPVILIEICGGFDSDTCSKEMYEVILHTKRKLEGMGYTLEKLQTHDYMALPK